SSVGSEPGAVVAIELGRWIEGKQRDALQTRIVRLERRHPAAVQDHESVETVAFRQPVPVTDGVDPSGRERWITEVVRDTGEQNDVEGSHVLLAQVVHAAVNVFYCASPELSGRSESEIVRWRNVACDHSTSAAPLGLEAEVSIPGADVEDAQTIEPSGKLQA